MYEITAVAGSKAISLSFAQEHHYHSGPNERRGLPLLNIAHKARTQVEGGGICWYDCTFWHICLSLLTNKNWSSPC
jgi:hypothetical protein